MRPTVVLRDADVDGHRVDVTVAQGRVADVAPSDRSVRRSHRGIDHVVEADGGALIPGLHDHHVHLQALAAARRSVVMTSTGDIAASGAQASDEWLRVVGYHEVEHGPLDRQALDRLAPDRPVRVLHQTGRLWILNSRGLAAAGLADHPDGRLFEADELLRERVPRQPVDLAAVGRELAGYGVTGVTDATPSAHVDEMRPLLDAARDGLIPQRLLVTGSSAVAQEVARLSDEGRVGAGPVKVIVSDVVLPTLDDLLHAFTAARVAGRTLAVHAVTRVALVLALAAWHEVGASVGDRVEHGGVVPPELAAQLAALGVVVVTQPSFIRERGDRFAAEVEPDDLHHLYPCGRLIEHGVGVAGSTDAPFGDADPWKAMATAMDRRTRDGRVLGCHDRIGARRALDLFLGALHDPAGPPRRVEIGAPADLCLLHVPIDVAMQAPSSRAVRAVMCDGRFAAGDLG